MCLYGAVSSKVSIGRDTPHSDSSLQYLWRSVVKSTKFDSRAPTTGGYRKNAPYHEQVGEDSACTLLPMGLERHWIFALLMRNFECLTGCATAAPDRCTNRNKSQRWWGGTACKPTTQSARPPLFTCGCMVQVLRMRLGLGRRLVDLVPVAQQTNTFTNGVVGQQTKSEGRVKSQWV